VASGKWQAEKSLRAEKKFGIRITEITKILPCA